MPRLARQKSESSFYHVLLRGIGKQNIFEDDEDRRRFIETMERYKKELGFEIHAYCLMGNHIHILIKDVKRQIELIIKKIAGSYAYYFNWKYERVGHVFQDRFKSEPIESDEYYLTVLRYIHQNPEKAKIEMASQYKWSSYADYIDGSGLIETLFALEMLGGEAGYVTFMEAKEEKICLEISEQVRLTDEKAIAIIKKKTKVKNMQEIQQLDIDKRDTILAMLKKEGLSIRQISRLTGINRGVVLKA